ncbi:SMI1/KNR4 family protein [Streptomyces sp. WG-D5]
MSNTADRVQAAWTRIEDWLRVHAPVSYEGLAPPADPTEVERAQTELGLRFPDSLLRSLARHDGLRHWGLTFPVASPCSVAGIVDFWRMRMDILRYEVWPDQEEAGLGDDDLGTYWDPRWIPWAHDNADAQIIDLSEGPERGRLGMSRHDGSGDFTEGWPSLADYLEAVADVLERGGTVATLAPLLREGYADGRPELCWDVLDASGKPRNFTTATAAPTPRSGG